MASNPLLVTTAKVDTRLTILPSEHSYISILALGQYQLLDKI